MNKYAIFLLKNCKKSPSTEDSATRLLISGGWSLCPQTPKWRLKGYRGSEIGAPSTEQFLKFFNKNNAFLNRRSEIKVL